MYHQFYPTIIEAILEEKRIKGGNRKQKTELINSMNPNWEDLWERRSTTFELEASRSLNYTAEEKEAGNGTRQLTQMSPAPQTLISVEAPKGKAFLVSFPLNVSMKASN